MHDMFWFNLIYHTDYLILNLNFFAKDLILYLSFVLLLMSDLTKEKSQLYSHIHNCREVIFLIHISCPLLHNNLQFLKHDKSLVFSEYFHIV